MFQGGKDDHSEDELDELDENDQSEDEHEQEQRTCVQDNVSSVSILRNLVGIIFTSYKYFVDATKCHWKKEKKLEKVGMEQSKY